MKKWLFVNVLLLMTSVLNAQNTPLTPKMFGLDTAKNDTDRYWVLYNMHHTACQYEKEVDYQGIGELNIEIPADAQPIPLNGSCNFQHMVLNVTNNSKAIYLFSLTQPSDTIAVRKEQVDNGDFSGLSQLDTNTYLLILQDDTKWIDKRQGYSYGHTRKDILLIDKLHAVNRPVMPYNTDDTKLSARICPVTREVKSICNITINRNPDNKYKTYCFDVQNQCNVDMGNITINTPTNNFYADAAIRITNCANVRLRDIIINGTYSQSDRYGYGISMDNVWRSQIVNMKASAKWGIFGNNNINEALLDSCDINRYDIHCYGRDVVMRNCTFSNLYNQFSSVYGNVIFEKCIFNNHIPVLLESSYNAYTPFDLFFYNCTFNINSRRNYLVDARDLTNVRNSRPEVRDKNLPNITLSHPTVIKTDKVRKWYMFHFSEITYSDKVGHLERIEINDIAVSSGQIRLKTSNIKFQNALPIGFPLRNQVVGK